MTKHGSNQGYLIALVLAAACWGFGAVMRRELANTSLRGRVHHLERISVTVRNMD
jgi:hypothetical protein